MSELGPNGDMQGKSWLDRLVQAWSGEPTSREDLIQLLRAAEQRKLLDTEVLSIIEGALHVADIQVRHIMLPRSQVVMLQADMPVEELLRLVIESGHSRFPVTGDDSDQVLGILLAKDLLALALPGARRFNVKELLRPTYAVPESKRVNVLLQDFRDTRNHLAIVYDEYGGVAGIVTIEDVLEQIVGEIEDEFDYSEEGLIRPHVEDWHLVKAVTSLEEFNKYFESELEGEESTVGGLVTRQLGHLPKRGEEVQFAGFQFRVLNSDARRIHQLQVTRLTPAAPQEE